MLKFKRTCIKIITLLLTSVIALTYACPFSIHAIYNGTPINNGFVVGVNINIIDREFNVLYQSISIPNNNITSTASCYYYKYGGRSTSGNTQTLYAGGLYCSDVNDNTITESYTFNIPSQTLNINYSELNKYIYEYEIVLNDNYIGSLKINNKIQFVNGNSLTVTDGEYMNSFTFTDINLIVNTERTWNFPIESFVFIDSVLKSGKMPLAITNYNYYSYPLFQLNQNDTISNLLVNSGQDVHVIAFFGFGLSSSSFDNYFSYDNNFTRSAYNRVHYEAGRLIVHLTFTNNSNQQQRLNLKYKYANSTTYIPIYAYLGNTANVSTDFAMQFGMNNRYINTVYNIDNNVSTINNNLYTLLNGNTSSNNSVSNADQTNSNLSNANDDYINFQEQMNDNLDSALNNVNTNITISTNQGFVKAASFVRDRFNDLTTNNAFGYMINFALIIGLALTILGKLRS